MAGPVVISIIGDTRDLVRKLGDSESRLGRFGRAAGGAGKLVAGGVAVVGAAAGALALSAVKSASNAQQSLGATQTVFGKYADTVVSRSKQASQAYGLSANEYRESANLIGSLFKNQGVAADQLGAKTDKMVSLGSDLAATFGGKTSDAVAALGSAFKGEFDPLERFGISLKQSTINAELAKRGQDKLTGAALASAKQQATSDIIMRQSADSLGAFGRESNTLAGQQQRLGASWEDLKAKGGTLLLPILTKLAGFVNANLLPAIERMGPPIMRFAQAAGAFLAPILAKVKDLIRAAVPYVVQIAQGIGRMIPPAISFAQTIAAKLRPVLDQLVTTFKTQVLPTLVRMAPTVLKIVGVVGRLIGFLIKTGATVAGAVLPPLIRFAGFMFTKVFPAVVKVIGVIVRVISFLVRLGVGLATAVVKVVQFAAKIIGAIASIPGRVGNAITALVQKGRDLITGVVRGITSSASKMGTKVRELVGALGGKIGNAAGELLGVGKDLIRGLISGIGAMASTVANKARDVVKGAINAAKSALGINSPSRVFRDIGLRTTEGLGVGLKKGTPAVARIMRDLSSDLSTYAVTGAIGGSTTVPKSPTRFATSVGTPGGGLTVNVTLEVPVGATGAEIGRELVGFIEDYYRTGGRKL